jgi:mannose-6-phosphate isomerase-like protein (cupin superfamily)
MKITSYKDFGTSQNPHGVDARVIFNTDAVQVVHIALEKGEGYLDIGDETQKVVKDMLIDSPKDIPHRPFNKDSDVFRFLVVKLKK